MADKVGVKLSHAYGDKEPGDTVEVEPVEAKALVRNGIGRYAKVADAKKVGADPADAATKH